MNKYYRCGPVNIHTQSLINIIREKIGSVSPKKGKGKLPLFHSNGEREIPIYAASG